ncbi:MAG: hypothetical protein XU10_C0036G0003 [Chloroflexi bacterium CSP1-4]|nr:MAG: hypothetical protein XU10_C0036G0003 [Chloroflexi bacterium CSP1-4]
MKKLIVVASVVVLVVGVMGVAAANGDSQRNAFKARLGGYQEVPSISTTGNGELRLKVNPAGTEIAYTLTYSGLQGGAATASHIHFAQSGVNGGVLAWLCGGGDKPACPVVPATVTGTIDAPDILAIQGIAAGDMAAALRAIRAGVTYANVHNAGFPGGEIRGQIRAQGNGKGKGKND